jgi:CubicO group peptidase (beta-lactamase class C family)
MSVAVVQRQKVVLARGYGYADLENKTLMTENTPFNIASCTKPFAATVLMKLAEEGKLDLDARMADLLEDTVFPLPFQDETIRGYTKACKVLVKLGQTKDFPLAFLFKDYCGAREPITVRHHLPHTSQGVPGETYRYNGFLYGWLSLVAEKASGKPFAELVVEYITAPLGMTRTVPNANRNQRDRILAERTKYYQVSESGNYELSTWPPRELVEILRQIHPKAADTIGRLNAGAGIISTARDLARFDLAMARNQIVAEASKESMFTVTRSNSGQALPYGLGWFVQEHQGVKLVWHFGWAPHAFSSLLLKAPEKGVTLILLANSDGASAPFNLSVGDVLASPLAAAFLTHFADMEVRSP